MGRRRARGKMEVEVVRITGRKIKFTTYRGIDHEEFKWFLSQYNEDAGVLGKYVLRSYKYIFIKWKDNMRIINKSHILGERITIYNYKLNIIPVCMAVAPRFLKLFEKGLISNEEAEEYAERLSKHDTNTAIRILQIT